MVAAGAGMKTPFGLALLPPGSRIAAYVRSTGVQIGDDPFLNSNLVSTLAAGVARARAGLGDTVVVLPGHTESVTDATMLSGLVAGTRIMGFGRGSNMPVFRWTATAAQWALSVADVTIQGLRLRLEGANGVVKAINVTGADCGIYGCDIEVSSGAANLATIALEVGVGATRFELVGNLLRGVAAGVATDGVKVVSTNQGIRIEDNEMAFATTTTNGLVHFTTAALDTRVARNLMLNSTAVSVACIVYDNVAVTGVCADNRIAVLSTGAHTANVTGITTGASTLVRFFENYSSNDLRTSGLLVPAADT
jgi:hypothetical protein